MKTIKVIHNQLSLEFFNTKICGQGMEYVGVLWHCLVSLLTQSFPSRGPRCDVMMSFYDEFSLMTNKVQKNSNQILEGKVHCKNVIGIEIPTVKLQEN
jgi:hypothetical protein